MRRTSSSTAVPYAVPLLALALTSACTPSVRPALQPDPRAVLDRLAAADSLVRAGCLDCLEAAFREYDTLRSVPAFAGTATGRALRTGILVGLRERELGLEPSGILERVRDLSVSDAPLQERLEWLSDILDSMPVALPWSYQLADDARVPRWRHALDSKDAWLARLHAGLGDDPTSAYLWLALNCANSRATRETVDAWMAELAAWRDVPLIELKQATCGTVDAAALERLLQADPRFVELHDYLGNGATLRGRPNEAIDHLLRAYAWRPRWPVVTNSIANLYLGVEEFDQAVDFFDHALKIVPAYPDALLGKARALTYVKRHADALRVIDELLALGRWYIGDARYWRAFNEMQLGQNDAAWADVEEAGKLVINAAVPKLAGMIAYRRKHIDVSRARFEQSYERNRLDCETGFYLGVVLAEQAAWARTADVLIETAACLDAAQHSLAAEIERIRNSDDPPARRQRRIEKREQQVAAARRMMATSWFNVAVASYYLSRKDDARAYAERVAADEEFGVRARELLSRLR